MIYLWTTDIVESKISVNLKNSKDNRRRSYVCLPTRKHPQQLNQVDIMKKRELPHIIRFDIKEKTRERCL